MDQNSVISTIKKLMAYAGDGSATDAEAENALRHAKNLMDKFNLEDKDILLDESKKESLYESMTSEDIYQRAHRIDNFDVRLAKVPSIICDVGYYTREDVGKNKRGHQSVMEIIVFYGLPRDIAIAKEMYLELLVTMRAMARFRLGDLYGKELKSYGTGFVDALVQKAQKIKQAPPVHSDSTAIVVSKGILLKKFKQSKLDLGPRSGRATSVNDDIYNQGSSDGSKVSLKTNQVKGPSRETRSITGPT